MSERELQRAIEGAFCPEAEVLGQFLDETLETELQERVAAHLLRCESCQDVAAWTREAEAQQVKLRAARPKVRKTKSGTGRHRSATGRHRSATGRHRSATGRHRRRANTAAGVPTWAPAVAAAAGLLLVALIGLKASNSTTPGNQLGQVSPIPTPTKVTPGPTRSALPTPAPSEAPTASPQPSEAPTASPQPSEVPTPSRTPQPTPSPTPSHSPAPTPGGEGSVVDPVRTPGKVWVAALEPGVSWRAKDASKRQALSTPQELSDDVTLESQGAAGVQVGTQRIQLGPRATLALVSGGVRPLGGQALVSGAGAIQCEQVRIQSVRGDEVFVAEQRGALLLVVVAGSPRGPQGALRPGQAFRVSGAGLEPAGKPEELERLAAGFTRQRSLQGALSVPGGLVLRAALSVGTERLSDSSLAKRAQALRVVEACWAAAPRLSADSLLALEEAHAELSVLAPSALVAEGAAADYALAAVARARRTKSLETSRVALSALATALRGDEASLRSPDALLALRAVERATKSKEGTFWRKAAESLKAQAPSRAEAPLLAALVGGPRAAKAGLASLDAQLATDPLTTPLTPDALWGVAQRLILANAWTPARARRLRGHLEVHLSQPTAPELAYVAARHAARVLGGKIRSAGEDRRRALPIPGGYRVTIVFSSPRKPRTVHLCGSWDKWQEDTTPMVRRRDGAFEVTLDLPPGRHEYKLRLDGGRLWETDGDNALETADTRGGRNSVLFLP